ncbi:MAG: hypothetical protein LBU19_06680 [Treponema sp.]|nr:hypothetical protein [Treponema sp.]
MENTNDDNIQNDGRADEEGKGGRNGKNTAKKSGIHKITVSALLIAEIAITFSTIITFGFYDYFWKINGYTFTWFWLKGLLGIILFIAGSCREKIIFKKNFIKFLIVPVIFSALSFTGVIRGIIHPWNYNYYIQDSLKEMCYVIGFPLWILYFLQERHGANKFLIGISAFLTPIARFVVNFNIWIR